MSKSEFDIPHSTFNIEFFAPQKTLGGYCGGVPPLPIPNREVKPACADGTAMQCGRVGGCLLYLRSSESNDFGDLFLFRRVWHPAIPTPPPMVSDSVGIADTGSYNIVVFLTICISYANNCFTL